MSSPHAGATDSGATERGQRGPVATRRCVGREPAERGGVSEERFSSLIEAIAQRRDTGAFAELFRHFAPRLKAYCMRGGADAATAEEVVQEAMLSVWRRADSFDPARASATTWIFTIVRNRRIDALRRERRPEPDPAEAADERDPAGGPDAEVAAAQVRDRLAAGLAGLPEEQARVLHMAYFEDRPHSEISAALGLPLGTVKSRIRLALARLRGVAEALQ